MVIRYGSLKNGACREARDIDGQIRAGSGRADGQAANQTAYWLELVVATDIASFEELAILRKECDQLTAIFVSIIKQSKATPENS